MLKKKQWIWQDEAYPNFEYNAQKLENLVQRVARKQGELMALSQVLGTNRVQKSQLEALENEIIASSAIEGEVLDRESVKSSLKERLGIEEVQHYRQETKESNYVEILLDATLNYKEELTLEKIYSWHYKLFEKHNNLWGMQIGAFRKEGTMQIVSGVIGKEKVFYEAPDSSRVEEEMKRYIEWFNNTPASLLKASLAHLWFVVIHPFDDGNGRITRAITDRVLSQIEDSKMSRIYSMSKSINSNRKAYYKALEQTTGYVLKENLMDITTWHEWFLKTLESSLDESINSINHVIAKAKFWDRHRESSINERQRKFLNAFLDRGVYVGLTTKKYIKITGATSATASRDIKRLVEMGCIGKIEGSAGRNVRYEILF